MQRAKDIVGLKFGKLTVEESMPSHNTHDAVAVILAPIITAGMATQTTPKNALIFGASFLLSNWYLSPDLDTNSILNKRWSVLNILWIPYRRLFHHRSFWTHSGPISAIIRLMYLLALLSPVILFCIPWIDIVYYSNRYSFELGLFVIAACISDMIHTILDYGTTFLTRLWKNTYRHY